MPERIFNEDLFENKKVIVEDEVEHDKHQIVEITDGNKRKLFLKFGLIVFYIIIFALSLLLV